MSKKIEFNYNGTDYVLEYNRKSIEFMERQGFVLSELIEKPMLMLPMAFEGLFLKNHKNVKRTEVEEIYNKFKNKDSLIQTIADMLNETYSTLQEEPEGNEGNIDWKVV